MVFAAGLGTRLGEIGRDTPKALIEVGGRTMLEHVCARLVAAGADRIIVNVHHHAAAIERFLESYEPGAEVLLSVEAVTPLETGGGLLHAAPLFRRDAPFFLHNVDVVADADLRSMYAVARDDEPMAVLAVNERPTSRYLLFDEVGLFGRIDRRDGTRVEVRPSRGSVREYAFAGIHVASPAFLDAMTERGAFSILEPYLRLAGEGARILPFALGDSRWLEIGSPERLAAARATLEAESAARDGA